MTRIEKARRTVRVGRAQARSSESLDGPTRSRGGALRPAGTPASSTLRRLLATHRDLILQSARSLDAGDLEAAVIEGVRGLMDAMTAFARGSERTLDELCVDFVQQRIAEQYARQACLRAA